ncbi:hypothetical protein PVK06_027324 [Gossypium arboreum]|uniref:Uncharacterized protein n=1 Tax=Gossypium arboreum TaxID=29729 RepID=A0ABR0NZZ2_GOSAR|nr:hypothetical protein PVK06_027324 [Gossypium arboreum]
MVPFSEKPPHTINSQYDCFKGEDALIIFHHHGEKNQYWPDYFLGGALATTSTAAHFPMVALSSSSSSFKKQVLYYLKQLEQRISLFEIQQFQLADEMVKAEEQQAQYWTYEPAQTPIARAEFANLKTSVDEGEIVAEEPEKITSLNLKNEKEEEKDEIVTDTIATTEGKDHVPPILPASTTAQGSDIDHLIDELTETDKEGDEMITMKKKLQYKVRARKSTRKAK